MLLALFTAVLLAWSLPALARALAPGEPVVVAAADLPAGTVIGPEHLTVVDLPPTAVRGEPPLREEQLLGAVLTQPVPEGAWLRPDGVDASSGRALPAGTAAVSVPVDPSLLPLLHEGSEVRITLSGTDPTAPRTIRATVISLPEAQKSAGDGLVPDTSGLSVVLAVQTRDLRDIAISTFEGWVYLSVLS